MSRRSADALLMYLGPPAAAALIRFLRWCIRWRAVNAEVVVELHRRGEPYIHAFFHDQLLLMTWSYRGREFGRTLAVMSSRHRDGEYVARTLERFGHIMVRGSSGHGGVGGLREMVRQLRRGRDAAFAVDGPRGPRHAVQPGVVEAARLGGVSIVPVALAVSRKRRLRSWDAFQIPLPFARGLFIYGDAMRVPPDAGRDALDALRLCLERILEDLTVRAEAMVTGKA